MTSTRVTSVSTSETLTDNPVYQWQRGQRFSWVGLYTAQRNNFTVSISIHSRHLTLDQCWFKVGTPSVTPAQHYISNGVIYRVYSVCFCMWTNHAPASSQRRQYQPSEHPDNVGVLLVYDVRPTSHQYWLKHRVCWEVGWSCWLIEATINLEVKTLPKSCDKKGHTTKIWLCVCVTKHRRLFYMVSQISIA